MPHLLELYPDDQLLSVLPRVLVVLDQRLERYVLVRDDSRVAVALESPDGWFVGAHADRVFFATEADDSCVVYEWSAFDNAPIVSHRVPFLVRCMDFFGDGRALLSGDDGAAVIGTSSIERLFDSRALSTHIAHREVIVSERFVVALSTDFGVECRRMNSKAPFERSWSRFDRADANVTVVRLLRSTRDAVAMECFECGHRFVDVVRIDDGMLLCRHTDVGHALYCFGDTLVFANASTIDAIGAFDGALRWRITLPAAEPRTRASSSAGERALPPIAFGDVSLWVQHATTLTQYDLDGRERSSLDVSPSLTLVAAYGDTVGLINTLN